MCRLRMVIHHDLLYKPGSINVLLTHTLRSLFAGLCVTLSEWCISREGWNRNIITSVRSSASKFEGEQGIQQWVRFSM